MNRPPDPSRRPLRPPPRGPRPISPHAPLEGRQLWRVGDWGGASGYIGHRWEELGQVELRALLGHPRPGPGGGTFVPRAAVVISADPALSAAVHRGGKPHADAILVGCVDGRPVLEPVDFKWTLETAEPRQVGAEVLSELLTDPPSSLEERLRQAVAEAGCALESESLLVAGCFLAPDSLPNREQVGPRGRLPDEMVVLRPVDGLRFFSPLPGWDVAQALAGSDHANLARVEAAERYYRLGAGVLGALRRLHSSLFADELVELDGVATLAELRARQRLRTTGELIAHLDRALRARAELAERLQTIERSVYPFSAFRKELARRRVPMEDPRRHGRLHGEVLKVVRADVRREGRKLVQQGRTELQALQELEGMTTRFARVAQREAERQITALLDSEGNATQQR